MTDEDFITTDWYGRKICKQCRRYFLDGHKKEHAIKCPYHPLSTQSLLKEIKMLTEDMGFVINTIFEILYKPYRYKRELIKSEKVRTKLRKLRDLGKKYSDRKINDTEDKRVNS